MATSVAPLATWGPSQSASINIATLPLCPLGTDAWPTCNPVNSSGLPCYSSAVNGEGVMTPVPEYCNPFLLVGASLAILILAPGGLKIAAIAPIAAYFLLPTCTANNGCPGTSD